MVVVKNCEKTKVSVEVSVGEISENLECDIKARYRSLGNRFIVCSGKEEISMDKFLTEQPLIYKTVKDMTITGIDVIEGDFESELFDSNIIEGIDWKHYDTNLKLEFRKNDSDTRVSIQDALYKILEADENLNILYTTMVQVKWRIISQFMRQIMSWLSNCIMSKNGFIIL